jgi:hypothetical protein
MKAASARIGQTGRDAVDRCRQRNSTFRLNIDSLSAGQIGAALTLNNDTDFTDSQKIIMHFSA